VSNIHHLERSLRKLRLTRVGAEWHALEKRALAEGWTPSRYLLTLCNEELLWRESEKLRRYKRKPGCRSRKPWVNMTSPRCRS
jgi:hypothetical protein